MYLRRPRLLSVLGPRHVKRAARMQNLNSLQRHYEQVRRNQRRNSTVTNTTSPSTISTNPERNRNHNSPESIQAMITRYCNKTMSED